MAEQNRLVRHGLIRFGPRQEVPADLPAHTDLEELVLRRRDPNPNAFIPEEGKDVGSPPFHVSLRLQGGAVPFPRRFTQLEGVEAVSEVAPAQTLLEQRLFQQEF